MTFKFASNPYFEDEELTKEYYLENLLRGKLIWLSSRSSAINWNPGKNLTIKSIKKKNKKGACLICQGRLRMSNHDMNHAMFCLSPVLWRALDDRDIIVCVRFGISRLVLVCIILCNCTYSRKHYRRVPKCWTHGSVCCACGDVTKTLNIVQWVQDLGTLGYHCCVQARL